MIPRKRLVCGTLFACFIETWIALCTIDASAPRLSPRKRRRTTWYCPVITTPAVADPSRTKIVRKSRFERSWQESLSHLVKRKPRDDGLDHRGAAGVHGVHENGVAPHALRHQMFDRLNTKRSREQGVKRMTVASFVVDKRRLERFTSWDTPPLAPPPPLPCTGFSNHIVSVTAGKSRTPRQTWSFWLHAGSIKEPEMYFPPRMSTMFFRFRLWNFCTRLLCAVAKTSPVCARVCVFFLS